jgi:hypothetical protein
MVASPCKARFLGWARWLMAIILATEEANIKRIII